MTATPGVRFSRRRTHRVILHPTQYTLPASPIRMLRPLLICAALALATAPAAAGSFAGTTGGAAAGGTSASTGGTSASSQSTSGSDKVVLQAREDAAGFVASQGRIRSARLEAALRHLREHNPDDQVRQASDMALAKAILAL